MTNWVDKFKPEPDSIYPVIINHIPGEIEYKVCIKVKGEPFTKVFTNPDEVYHFIGEVLKEGI
jgi:hypothetical protein